jgi:2-desacetyl-2-hydroxyethyl bacteriochlorophyllide A dehydrogenase
MKAARLVGPRQFEFLDAEVPAIKDGEVLVKMRHLSVCGSDLRTYDRTLPEENYPLAVGAPCHECVGEVVESHDPRFKKGEVVIALAGGLLEYAAVPAHEIVQLKPNVDPELAVLCQPAGTVLYSVQQIGAILGQKVLVIGQGPIGLNFTDLLVRGGAVQVITADRLDYRLDHSKKLGATHTVNVTKEDLLERVKEITGGEMVDVAIEACGRPEAFNQMFQALRHHGTAILFGMQHDFDGALPLDWERMYERQPRMIATSSARAGERAKTVAAVVDLVSQGRLNLSYQATHRVSFDDVGKAFEMYSGKLDNSLKIIMDL